MEEKQGFRAFRSLERAQQFQPGLDFSLITQLSELNQAENNAHYNRARLNQLEGKTYSHFASRFFGWNAIPILRRPGIDVHRYVLWQERVESGHKPLMAAMAGKRTSGLQSAIVAGLLADAT